MKQNSPNIRHQINPGKVRGMEMLSPLELSTAIKQGAAKPTKKMERGAEPRPDAGATGAKVAHIGQSGAPNIYREKPGGRRGGRGKRLNEQ